MAEESLRPLLVEKMKSYFAEKGWQNIEYNEEYSLFRLNVSLDCKLKRTQMTILCKEGGIKIEMDISIGTDDENKVQVMEFVTRANYGLNLGGFQMDLDHNRIEYILYLPCEDVPTLSSIDRVMNTGYYMLERYGNELLAVMFGMKNAKDAIEAAERRE